MTRRWPFITLALVMVGDVALAEIPLTLRAPDSSSDLPEFISLPLAAPKGRPQRQWFDPEAYASLRSTLAQARRLAENEGELGATTEASSERCDVLIKSHPTYYQSQPSVEQLVRQSTALVLGEVVDKQVGFLRGTPTTLYEVTVEHVYVWPAGIPTPTSVLIESTSTQLTLEGVSYCTRVEGSTAEPAEEDHVLVATFRELGGPGAPMLDGRYLLSPLPEEILIRRRGDSEVAWKQRIESWESIEGTLRRLIVPGKKVDDAG